MQFESNGSGLKAAGSGLRRTLIVSSVAALALGGCSTNKRGGPVPYGVTNFGAPEAVPVTQASTQYRIAPGDVLSVSVYKVPDLTRDVEVDSAGGFNYPPLGRVEANDRTPGDVGKELQTKLGDQYLQSPLVQISVKSTIANQITVDGSVSAPGLYPVPPGTTLLQALAIAKGPVKDANLRRVVVFRRIDGQRMAAAFDLIDIRRGVASDPEVYPRDVIVVDGATGTKWTDVLAAVPLLTLFRPF